MDPLETLSNEHGLIRQYLDNLSMAAERIEKKATIHPDWPSFNSPEGKAIQYGSESCPRTIDILGRTGGVIMDPNFSDDDVKDIVRAIRKVYLAMHTA